MKLLAKFNLLLLVIFVAGFFGVSYFIRAFLKQDASEQTLQQAKLMISSARSTRDYTEQEIDPLLERSPEAAKRFLPQTIPFHAANVTFQHLHSDFPDYTYKEAALNPTNLRDRADQWEGDIISYFRGHPGATEFTGERQTAVGSSISYAKPISADAGCLKCHGSPSEAPATEIAAYGSSNGFGWQPHEIVGAQIVSVPTEVPMRAAQNALHKLMLYLAALYLATIVAVDAALYVLVIRPLRRIAVAAENISKGDMSQPHFDSHGADEIAQTAASFNRLYVSLGKAMRSSG